MLIGVNRHTMKTLLGLILLCILKEIDGYALGQGWSSRQSMIAVGKNY